MRAGLLTGREAPAPPPPLQCPSRSAESINNDTAASASFLDDQPLEPGFRLGPGDAAYNGAVARHDGGLVLAFRLDLASNESVREGEKKPRPGPPRGRGGPR